MKSSEHYTDKPIAKYIILYVIVSFILESIFHYLMDLALPNETANMIIHAAVDVIILGGIGLFVFVYYSKEKQKMQEYIYRLYRIEALGLVASGMAHEINNNLMKIVGCAEVALSDSNLQEKTFESIISLKKFAIETGNTIDQLLTYTGNTTISLDWIDLNLILVNAIELLQPTIPNSILVKLDTDPNIPKVHVDQAMITRIVLNLIENALEAIGDNHGNINISTGNIMLHEGHVSVSNFDYNLHPGEFIYIEISDTGIGIDPEDYERIFDPFFTTKFIGRGLGLSVVLGILRAHNAAIEGTSERGKGSSFKILIPVLDHD